jgi:hypothetical protein
MSDEANVGVAVVIGESLSRHITSGTTGEAGLESISVPCDIICTDDTPHYGGHSSALKLIYGYILYRHSFDRMKNESEIVDTQPQCIICNTINHYTVDFNSWAFSG